MARRAKSRRTPAKQQAQPKAQANSRSVGVRSDGRETAERVLAVALAELEVHGAVNFSLDRVIEESKVSRSSIYHLFGSRSGVIAHAEARAVALDVSDGAHLLRNLAEKVESREQLAMLIDAWLQDAMSPVRVRQRARRIANIAASQADPHLREVLHRQIHDVSAVWVETYEILLRRKLVEIPKVDLRSLAIAVQGVYLGGILVDIYDDATAASGWSDVVAELLARFFGLRRP